MGFDLYDQLRPFMDIPDNLDTICDLMEGWETPKEIDEHTEDEESYTDEVPSREVRIDLTDVDKHDVGAGNYSAIYNALITFDLLTERLNFDNKDQVMQFAEGAHLHAVPIPVENNSIVVVNFSMRILTAY